MRFSEGGEAPLGKYVDGAKMRSGLGGLATRLLIHAGIKANFCRDTALETSGPNQISGAESKLTSEWDFPAIHARIHPFGARMKSMMSRSALRAGSRGELWGMEAPLL
jgi:hypothetical protein